VTLWGLLQCRSPVEVAVTPGPVTVPPEQRGLVVALAALTLERSAPEELAVLPQLRTLLDEAQTFRVDGPEVARINGHLVWSLRAEVAALESQAAALGTGDVQAFEAARTADVLATQEHRTWTTMLR